KTRGAQERLVLIRIPIMPEHNLLILGEAEVAFQPVGSILLHGALKRRHGVLDCETGRATMANHQEWCDGVTSCSPPGIAPYHLKKPLWDKLEIVRHIVSDDTRALECPIRPPPPPDARRCTDPSGSLKYPAGRCAGETGPRRGAVWCRQCAIQCAHHATPQPSPQAYPLRMAIHRLVRLRPALPHRLWRYQCVVC